VPAAAFGPRASRLATAAECVHQVLGRVLGVQLRVKELALPFSRPVAPKHGDQMCAARVNHDPRFGRVNCQHQLDLVQTVDDTVKWPSLANPLAEDSRCTH
jgi:hypothetical protein